jgi:hypothetical protein
VLRMPSVLKEALRGIVHEPFVPRGLWSDETVHSFVSRRFGDHAATRVFGGMVSGIYAGDIHRLSMKSCFPKLWNWERDHGSVLKGMFSKSSPNQDPFQGVVAEDSPFVQSYATAAQVSFKHGGWTWKRVHGAGRCCFTAPLLFVFVCARCRLGADVLDTLTVLCLLLCCCVVLLCLLCLLLCVNRVGTIDGRVGRRSIAARQWRDHRAKRRRGTGGTQRRRWGGGGDVGQWCRVGQ